MNLKNKRNYICLLTAAALLATLLGGCKAEDPEQADGTAAQTGTCVPAQDEETGSLQMGEDDSEIPAAGAESVCDAATEAGSEWICYDETEDMTEWVEMVSIREVMNIEDRIRAERFDEEEIRQLEYVMYGEEREAYIVTDKQLIREVFDALMELETGRALSVKAAAVGDSFRFLGSDGSELVFDFSMACYVEDGILYDTAGTDRLWELTSRIMDV